ncbi:hypothetical protein GCM10008018_72520 [Paenibacillus marchantiophytorum]|uniref:Endonuclease GajA/Old nuclease/RecF-like AAA domain-containing protein n=1 Tax=Paenibacillus marchantiophytorum TaxID=1619310 RepID=A0ABQ1FJP1_9BACL|nr:AAA family ATPase [Paenibacillus marchantiophytorum]GGA17950.1 hypothetical protein GCM10008018_72520 [Paenibacillus marchantiophytorum]
MQKIIIKNFGPIRELEFNLNKFQIFFGPQASGKSTLSKSVYYFKSIRDEIYEYIANHLQTDRDRVLSYNNIIYKLNTRFRSLFGFNYLQGNFFMEFNYRDEYFLKLKRVNNRDINFNFSKPFSSDLNRIISLVNSYKEQLSKEKRKRESLRSILGVHHRSFLNKIKYMLNDTFGDDREVLYIPAGRSLISTLSNKLFLLFQISEHDRNVDSLIREFSEKIMDTRDYFDRDINELIYEKEGSTDDVDYKRKYFMFVEILRNILGGDYRFIEGKDRFYINQRNYIPLNFASSGQQESVWILYLMIYYYLENKDCFIVIEEPEAHLFPKAQRDMLMAISLFVNNKNNQCIITTHSPYLVSSMNNLLYSQHINKMYGRSDLAIDQEFWIDPQSVVALFLSKGSVENMMDDETMLLTSKYIDTVSELNSDEFEAMYRIEMEEGNTVNFDFDNEESELINWFMSEGQQDDDK